jgi:putative phage-type endonuclease
MKFINLEQNTPEWLDFRRCHIGASDAPIIVGESKFKSAKKLREEKIFGTVEKENSFMKYGKDNEERARKQFNRETGFNCIPKMVQHSEHEWMTASLDGLDEEKGVLLEVKCPGAKTHQMAMEGLIPPQYRAQLQHQLACCPEIEIAYYYSWIDLIGIPPITIIVKRDGEYIKKMIDKELEFWESIRLLI